MQENQTKPNDGVKLYLVMFLKNKKSVIEFLSEKIKNIKGKIVIQAGHFALIRSKDETLIPAIVDNLNSSSLKKAVKNNPYMGSFPTETWKIALKLASKHSDKDIKISVIVNDWQWVNKTNNRQGNNLRVKFYEKNNKLPNSFLKLLGEYHLQETLILPFESESYCNLFFSEQKLRKIAKKTYKEVDFVSSGKSCAYGYLPFLGYVYEHSAELLISFTPKTCRIPINFATDEFIENQGNKLSVVNVFLNGTFQKDFFENTELETFNL